MAWWKHRRQVGGYISLAPRSRVRVYADGSFHAPDGPAVEARLGRAGHKCIGAAHTPLLSPRETEAAALIRLRAEGRRGRAKSRHAARLGRRLGHNAPIVAEVIKPLAATGHGGGTPHEAPTAETIALHTTAKRLKLIAAEAGVAAYGSKVQMVEALQAAGIDVAATLDEAAAEGE